MRTAMTTTTIVRADMAGSYERGDARRASGAVVALASSRALSINPGLAGGELLIRLCEDSRRLALLA